MVETSELHINATNTKGVFIMENQHSESKVSHRRSIAIIAHVDHGKTTLVDGLMEQTGTFRDNEAVAVCAMDSNTLERERGITILAKPTLVDYEGYKINIVDTPGHADFGGEVERVLGMVDSVVLIVDAGEGPMPQTRFVLRKALERGLRPIVVINKIDRENVDPNVALNQVFDLFIDLGATDEQLEFPYAFASGMAGTAKINLEDEGKDLRPILDLIVKHCPPPTGNPDAALQMQVSILDRSDFLGRMAIGRIVNGTMTAGMQVALLKKDGVVTKGKITKIFTFHGLKRVEATQALAGEIVAIAGLEDFEVSDTVTLPDLTEALPRIDVDEPTLKMGFLVNDSPFAGTEGKYVTSRQIRERLFKELDTNVAMRLEETADTSLFMVSGRGELHLGILIETMRREGFEFAVSRPEVIIKVIDGVECEPVERMLVDVPEEFMGAVIQEFLVCAKPRCSTSKARAVRSWSSSLCPRAGCSASTVCARSSPKAMRKCITPSSSFAPSWAS